MHSSAQIPVFRVRALGLLRYGVKPDSAFMAMRERLCENRLITTRFKASKASGLQLVSRLPQPLCPLE
jgi:hypothetical protein